MAWTTPRTWLTGEIVTAGNFNLYLKDNLNYLYNLPRFKARQSTALTLFNGGVLVNCNTEVYDADNMFTATDGTCDIRRSGVHSFGCCIREASNSGVGVREAKITNENEQTTIAQQVIRVGTDSSQARIVHAYSESYVTIGNTVGFWHYQNSGASIAADISNEAYPSIYGAWRGI